LQPTQLNSALFHCLKLRRLKARQRGKDYRIEPPPKVHLAYLFPFHAKRAMVRVRVAVRFGSLSLTTYNYI